MGLSGLPPLPTSSKTSGIGAGAGPAPPSGPMPNGPMPAGGSPFGGGLSGVIQAAQTIEQGAMQLAQQAPSLASLSAQIISMLRDALQSALGAMAQQGAGLQPPPPGAGEPPTDEPPMPPR